MRAAGSVGSATPLKYMTLDMEIRCMSSCIYMHDDIDLETFMTTDTTHRTPQDDGRPLGFWLKAVDSLLSQQIDAALESEGIDHRDWRLLNALAGTVDAPGLHDRLARKPHRVTMLAEHGWVELVDDEWTLTDEGRTTRDRLAPRVAAVRERVAAAVSPEDFATTLASLEAIARELGWEEGKPLPRRKRPRGRHGFGPHGFGPHGFGPHGHGFGPHRFGARGFHHGHRDAS